MYKKLLILTCFFCSFTFSQGTKLTLDSLKINKAILFPDNSLQNYGANSLRYGLSYRGTETPNSLSNGTYDAFGMTFILPDGTFGIIFRRGTSHASDKGVIVMQTSSNQGKTFSSAATIVTDAIYDVRNIAGGVTPTGRIWFAFSRYNFSTATFIDRQFTYSDDYGKSWKTPAIFASNTLPAFSQYGSLITIGDGELLLGLYEHDATTWTTHVVKSTDNGTTWGSPIQVLTDNTLTISPGEDTYVYLGSNNIIGLSRQNANSKLRQVKSTDNGVTWTDMGDLTVSKYNDGNKNTNAFLQSFTGVNGRKVLAAYFYDRTARRPGVIYGYAQDILNSVSGWQNISKTYLRSVDTTAVYYISGYLTVVHPYEQPYGFGWYFESNITNTATTISFITTPDSNEVLYEKDFNNRNDGVNSLVEALNIEYDMMEGFYNGADSALNNYDIGKAVSFNGGLTWNKHRDNPILSGTPDTFFGNIAKDPWCLKVGSTYYLYFSGSPIPTAYRIGLATSTDGVNFTLANGGNPVISVGSGGSWDDAHVVGARVYYDRNASNKEKWKMFYHGNDGSITRVGYATSSDGITWVKSASNPIITNGAGGTDDAGGVTLSDIWIDPSGAVDTIHAMVNAISASVSIDGGFVSTLYRAYSTNWTSWTKDYTDILPRVADSASLQGAHVAGASLLTLTTATSSKFRSTGILVGNLSGSTGDWDENRVYRVIGTPTTSTVLIEPPLQYAQANLEQVRHILFNKLSGSYIIRRNNMFVLGVTFYSATFTENHIVAFARNINDVFTLAFPSGRALALERGLKGEWDAQSAENLTIVRRYKQ